MAKPHTRTHYNKQVINIQFRFGIINYICFRDFEKKSVLFQIRLHDMKLHMSSNGQCQRNVMEIYDGTTSEDDKYGVFCDSKVTDYSSLTNRLYLRLRGSRLSEKPIFSGRYTVFKPGRATSSSYLGDDNRLLSIEIGGFTYNISSVWATVVRRQIQSTSCRDG